MFVPLHDHNPLAHIRFQYVTVTLIMANVLVFALFQSPLFGARPEPAALSFGLIPVVLNDLRELAPQYVRVPEELTLASYMFLHGNWLHLGGNMLFLWVFGDNVEDAMGHFRFAIFYLACGIAAGLVHAFMLPQSDMPLVGASGAVAGIISAYLMLHPRVRVWGLFLGRIPLRISAAWALGFWIAVQIYSAAFTPAGQIAWWAHLGGIFAGIVLILIMRRSNVRLFDRDLAET